MLYQLVFFVGLFSSTWANYFSGNVSLKEATLKDAQIDGSGYLDQVKADSLVVGGSLFFQDINIYKNLKISGSAKGSGLQCQKLEVDGSFQGQKINAETVNASGSFEASDIKVKELIKAFGNLSVQSGNLNVIDFKGIEAIFCHARISNIVIRPAKSDFSFFGFSVGSQSQQIVTLKGSQTVVKGDIVFESGRGTVYLEEGAEMKGRVIGGKVIKRS